MPNFYIFIVLQDANWCMSISVVNFIICLIFKVPSHVSMKRFKMLNYPKTSKLGFGSGSGFRKMTDSDSDQSGLDSDPVWTSRLKTPLPSVFFIVIALSIYDEVFIYQLYWLLCRKIKVTVEFYWVEFRSKPGCFSRVGSGSSFFLSSADPDPVFFFLRDP